MNILTTDDLTTELLYKLFVTADLMRGGLQTETKRWHGPAGRFVSLCEGKILATIFLEPSTRTRLSFETAMLRLGGKVISSGDIKSSSTAKGESLYDTIRTVAQYADILVVRSSEDFTQLDLRECSNVINGGAGGSSHPTQALLDSYTIWRAFGKLYGLNIAFVGDIENSRSIKSTINIVSRYNNKICCYDVLNPDWRHSDLIDTFPSLDVLYLNRVQMERHSSSDSIGRPFILNQEHLSLLNKNAIILNPGPRREELSPDLDFDPRVFFFDQAKNGLYARMALLDAVVSR